MWGTPGLARCSRRSNCDVGLDRALITSQSWTRTLAPSSGPASCSRPWRSHVDGIHCHCCIPSTRPGPRSIAANQAARPDGCTAAVPVASHTPADRPTACVYFHLSPCGGCSSSPMCRQSGWRAAPLSLAAEGGGRRSCHVGWRGHVAVTWRARRRRRPRCPGGDGDPR